MTAFERNVALQRKLGVVTEWLSPADVRFPAEAASDTVIPGIVVHALPCATCHSV